MRDREGAVPQPRRDGAAGRLEVQLADDGVVARQLDELAVPQPVDAAVADEADDGLPAGPGVEGEQRGRGGHLPREAGPRGVRADVGVGLRERGADAVEALGEVGAPRDGRPEAAADDLARLRAAVTAAHPVGDAVEAAPAVHQHVVLVLGAHEPAVAQRRRIDPYAPAPEQFREPVHVSSS